LELVSGVERRRRWRVDEKLRIVAEADAPGAVFAQVARRHDISRGLLWIWRQQMRRGELRPTDFPTEFVPINVISAAAVNTAPMPPPSTTAPAPLMAEIVLPDGTSLRVNAAIETATLRRLLGVLRG
jgi:transposase